MRSAVSVRLAALTATVATGLVLVVPVASAAPATGSPCARYVAVLAPGTTETRADADPTKPAGMLGQVGQELQRATDLRSRSSTPPTRHRRSSSRA